MCTNVFSFAQANGGFSNKKLNDKGFFGSGVYTTSKPAYAALYPTKIKSGATPNTAGEYCIIGALAVLGKVRPIVHDKQDYPAYPTEKHSVYHGKPMDKGYHTHYVSIAASGSYQAFIEGENNPSELADEFIFASHTQVLPNLLIYFTAAKGDADAVASASPSSQTDVYYSDIDNEDAWPSCIMEDEDNETMHDAAENVEEAESSVSIHAVAVTSSSLAPGIGPSSAAGVSSVAHSFPESVTVLKPSGETLGGSSDARVMIHRKTEQKFVLKYSLSNVIVEGATLSRAAVEFIANRMYSCMAVPVPDVALYTSDTKVLLQPPVELSAGKPLLLLSVHLPCAPMSVQTYLEIRMGASRRSLDLQNKTWQSRVAASSGDYLSPRLSLVRTSVASGFVLDCLLANWDVCGWLLDNLIVDKQGRVWRLDQGGCLIYRAKGALKMSFNGVVEELNSFRDPTTNPNTHLLFSQISQADVSLQIECLQAHIPTLLQLIPEGLRKVMKARLAYLTDGEWRNGWRDAAAL